MAKEISKQASTLFEQIKQTDENGNEYWSGRDLAKVLEYSQLHYLLAQDTSRFAFANTYQVVNPHTFLCTEETNTRRFARLVPSTRPMDNMQQSFGTPQEDE